MEVDRGAASVCLDQWDEGPGGPEQAGEVHGEFAFDVVWVGVEDAAAGEDSGVVDEEGHVGGGGGRGSDLRGAGDIRGQRDDHLMVRCGDLGQAFGTADGRVDAADGRVDAAGSECADEARADAPVGPGDEGDGVSDRHE